ncbi:TPA: LPXTG cell wall anchor domain-containing protein [Listeria monocytogenes]|nr:LPXTG cell wall anchor domain-containing protein [Listeria monocytogenes]
MRFKKIGKWCKKKLPLIAAVAILLQIFNPYATFLGDTLNVNAQSAGVSYKGQISYGGSTVGYFEVDGSQAFCIEHSKPTPATGQMNDGGNIYDNPKIAATLYNGITGNGNIFGDDWERGTVVTSLVLSRIYTGENAGGENIPGYQELYNKAMNEDYPKAEKSFSKTDVDSSISENVQKTETIKLNADSRNSIQYSVPSKVTVHNISTGKNTTGGTVTIKGGESFYLTAPLDYNSDYSSGELKGSLQEYNPILYRMNDGTKQKLVKGGWYDPINTISFKAHFEARTGNAVILKKDKDSGKPLSSAQYRVTGDDFDKTVTTNADGKSTLNDLIVGNYKVVETKAPNGYTIDSTPKTLEIKANETTTLNVNNKEAFFQVKLTKEDAETGAKSQGSATLQGAEYTFYADSALTKTLQTVTIGENNTAMSEKFSFENKTERTIYAKETQAPVGYNIDTKIYTVKATQDNQTTEVFLETATSKDKVIKGSVDLVKFADTPLINDPLNPLPSGQKMPLVGAEFTLTSDTTREVVATMVTGENGRAHQDELVYDSYTVHESVTPEGYKAVEDFKIKVDTEGKTYYYTLEDTAKRSEIKIVKKDATTGKVIPVAGVEFQILDVNGNVITQDINYPVPLTLDTFATSDDGTLVLPSSLTFGDYYLKEIKAPNGYTLNKELIPFTVDGSQELVTVECKNNPQMGKIIGEKRGEVVDNEATKLNDIQYTDELLANTEYDILAKDNIVTPDGTIRHQAGDVVEHVTTNENGMFESENHFLGTYLLRETKAPVGYVLDEDTEVTLSYAGQEVDVTSETVEMFNELAKSDIIVNKKGSDNRLLEGVEFGLYNSDGELIAKDKTNKNGQIVFENVPYGDYTMKELATVSGYLFNEKATSKVAVREDGANINSNFVNQQVLANAKLVKTDKATGKVLAGVEFELVNDKTNKTVGKYKTNKQGEIIVQNLPVGSYSWKETTALKGYKKNNKKNGFIVTDNDHQKTIVTKVTNEKVPPMPKTGDNPMIPVVAGGFVLVAGAGLFLFRLRKGKQM